MASKARSKDEISRAPTHEGGRLLSEHGGIDVAVPADAEVGEGPFWTTGSRTITWVDISRGEVRVSAVDNGHTAVHKLPMAVGAAVPVSGTTDLALAVAEGFGFLRSGTLELTQPFLRDPLLRMNDGKCDSQGRMWAGSTHVNFEAGKGALHVWDGGTPRIAVTGFSLPNGLGWSPDNSLMYLVDSTEHLLLKAPFNATDGEVGPFEPLAMIPEGLPDGLAVASDGSIWVAVWGASLIQRFSDDGKLLQSIRVPVSQPTSCAFGDNGELFVTSARSGLTPVEIERQPLAGSILRLSTDASGVPVRSFSNHE